MNEERLQTDQGSRTADRNDSLSQYLSFRFYRDNLESLRDKTKDSINNFLKTISEIEDDFLSALKNQQLTDEGHTSFLEENY